MKEKSESKLFEKNAKNVLTGRAKDVNIVKLSEITDAKTAHKRETIKPRKTLKKV